MADIRLSDEECPRLVAYEWYGGPAGVAGWVAIRYPGTRSPGPGVPHMHTCKRRRRRGSGTPPRCERGSHTLRARR